MPDPTEPPYIPDRYVVPDKPRNYDDVAMKQLNDEADERDKNRAEALKMEADKVDKEKAAQQDKQQNREASGRRADATAKPGPAERLVGDTLQNTTQRVANVTPPDPKLTAAQQEMKAKREASRLKDREVFAGKREPEKVPELPQRTGDRSR